MKFQSFATKLSPAIALCLVTSAASADSVYSTYHYLFDNNGNPKTVASGTETLNPGDWVAGYFFVNPTVCSNGCDLSDVTLQLDGILYGTVTPASLSGLKLEIFSNVTSSSTNIGKDLGDSLFQLNSPTSVLFDGNFGTTVHFGANSQDQNTPALLQPNTAYWLKLTNVSQSPELAWFYNGIQSNEYWMAYYGSGEGSPYIFQINGINSPVPRLLPANVPLPGAIWLMATALIGMGGLARKQS